MSSEDQRLILHEFEIDDDMLDELERLHQDRVKEARENGDPDPTFDEVVHEVFVRGLHIGLAELDVMQELVDRYGRKPDA